MAGIIGQGAQYSAVDTFIGVYRLAQLRREAEAQLAGYDFLLVPTTPTMPTLADLERSPLLRNSQLGYYTIFVNFFDLAALAVPVLPRHDGLPAGVTLVGACGADQLLAAAQDLPATLQATPAAAGAEVACAAVQRTDRAAGRGRRPSAGAVTELATDRAGRPQDRNDPHCAALSAVCVGRHHASQAGPAALRRGRRRRRDRALGAAAALRRVRRGSAGATGPIGSLETSDVAGSKASLHASHS